MLTLLQLCLLAGWRWLGFLILWEASLFGQYLLVLFYSTILKLRVEVLSDKTPAWPLIRRDKKKKLVLSEVLDGVVLGWGSICLFCPFLRVVSVSVLFVSRFSFPSPLRLLGTRVRAGPSSLAVHASLYGIRESEWQRAERVSTPGVFFFFFGYLYQGVAGLVFYCCSIC